MSRRVVILPESGDGITYRVPSAANPKETYHVDLLSYNCQGSCTCQHHCCRLAPLLSRLVGPAEAVKEGLVKLPKGRDVSEALMCKHVLSARRQFCQDVLRAIAEKNAAEARAGAARGFREA